MASTEEVLKALQNAKIATLAAPEPEELVIDAETRTITVPSSERLFGVTGDMNIERKYFRCPKIVGDNIDLSTHQIFIAYVYTETESGSIFPSIGVAPYHCEDVEVDGEDITFSWKLTGNVFKNPGFILFKMYAKKTETDPNTVFNTTPAIGTVLATIPDGTEEIVEEHPDVIAQIFDRLDALESGGSGGTGGTTNYENLSNKPQLNGVTLEGNKTLDQVGVLAKNQGASNSGKYLSVGSDGNVVPADAPSGGTVDPEQIKQAVNGYLEENPVSGMTAEQEQQLNQNTTDVAELKSALDNFQAITLSQIKALDNMFKICAYSSVPTSQYYAFCTAFGIDIPSEEEKKIQIITEQGNTITGGGAELNRVTVRVKNIYIPAKTKFSIGVPDGYSLYMFQPVTTNNKEESGELKELQDLYTTIIADNNDNVSLSNIYYNIPKRDTWTKHGVALFANSFTENGFTIGDIAFVVKKDDESNIAPDTIKLLLITSYEAYEG